MLGLEIILGGPGLTGLAPNGLIRLLRAIVAVAPPPFARRAGLTFGIAMVANDATVPADAGAKVAVANRSGGSLVTGVVARDL